VAVVVALLLLARLLHLHLALRALRRVLAAPTLALHGADILDLGRGTVVGHGERRLRLVFVVREPRHVDRDLRLALRDALEVDGSLEVVAADALLRVGRDVLELGFLGLVAALLLTDTFPERPLAAR